MWGRVNSAAYLSSLWHFSIALVLILLLQAANELFWFIQGFYSLHYRQFPSHTLSRSTIFERHIENAGTLLMFCVLLVYVTQKIHPECKYSALIIQQMAVVFFSFMLFPFKIPPFVFILLACRFLTFGSPVKYFICHRFFKNNHTRTEHLLPARQSQSKVVQPKNKTKPRSQ